MQRIIFYLLLVVIATPALSQIVELETGEKYQLLKLLGKGSSGRVFSGKEIRTNKPVALKFFFNEEEFRKESSVDLESIYKSPSKDYFVKRFAAGSPKADSIKNLSDLDSKTPGIIVYELADGTLENIQHELILGYTNGELAEKSERKIQMRIDKLFDTAYSFLNIWIGLAQQKLINGDLRPRNLGYFRSPFKAILIDIGQPVQSPVSFRYAYDHLRGVLYFLSPEQKKLKHYNGSDKDNDIITSLSDLSVLGISLSYLACGDCSLNDFDKMIENIEVQLWPNEKNLLRLAKLSFIRDIIRLSQIKSAEERFFALQGRYWKDILSFKPESLNNLGTIFPELKIDSSGIVDVYAKDITLVRCQGMGCAGGRVGRFFRQICNKIANKLN